MPLQKSVNRLPFTLDRELDSAFKYLAEPVESVLRIPLLDGRLIENFIISGSNAVTDIEHKLGRPFRGWFLTRHQKNTGTQSDIKEVDPQTDTSKFLTLTTSDDAITISLWVF